MNQASIFNVPNLHPLGRFHWESARQAGVLPLFWSGSGLELCFTGGELHILLEADAAQYEPWISVEVNGALLIRMPLHPGENDVCVFRGLSEGPKKRVRLLKEVQLMPEDAGRLCVSGLCWTDGAFLPLWEPAYRLEFVGDSLTSGEGLHGAREEMDFVSAWFGARQAFPRLTADLLNADCRCISQSGWGIRSDWKNDPRHALPNFYSRVCGPAAGPRNEALGAQLEQDFAGWRPDAIVVNLGTNDANAMKNPPCAGPSGAFFKQRNDAAGLALLEDAALDFLQELRRQNPGAKLVWAYGMAGDALREPLERAVTRFGADDRGAWFLPLPQMRQETMGSRLHPGPACHREAAEALAAFLKIVL